ncbi:MAG: hypothetical protein ROO76_01540 [Terriglobia bacterium]|nr:hypothetical protein [Terriglobia bacterium]
MKNRNARVTTTARRVCSPALTTTTNAVRVDPDEGVWANIKTGIVAGASPVLL